MSSPEEEEADFSASVIDNIFEVFIAPEIERRGGAEAVGTVTKALVVLEPQAGVQVLLNDEAEIVASIRATRPIEAGEEITEADFQTVEGLRPFSVSEEAGWVALATLPSGSVIAAFDFRRNRGKGRALLALATDYLATASQAADENRSGPCLDLAHTAAELAVTAMMYLTDDEPLGPARSRHQRRLTWLRGFTSLGNAPSDLHQAMLRLSNLRGSARYGEPALVVSEDDRDLLVEAVADLVDHAAERVGPPLPPVQRVGQG